MTKGDTHFLVPSNRGTQRIDLGQFLTEYLSGLTDNFMLGYYTHLVADELWLQEIFSHPIAAGPVKARKQLLSLYYQDFQQLNRFLINQYALVPYDWDITPVAHATVNLNTLGQLWPNTTMISTKLMRVRYNYCNNLKWTTISPRS
ncbi:hypothetical protein [Weissella cibaria]|uniref:hypothetical protein n=1 Tax=Weissella cibaria TaxID=137591 RepID=UPI0014314BB0|nr:hypothetical protein [Weissella cibaria]